MFKNSIARVVTKSIQFNCSKLLLERLYSLLIASGTERLAKRLKLEPIHTKTNCLQHPSVGTNCSACAFSYMAPTVWNKLIYCIRNAPSTIAFRKDLKPVF